MTSVYPSAARDVMRFHLVYSGALPASASSSKPADVRRIREALHPQLEHLWETHPALQTLLNHGFRRVANNTMVFGVGQPTPRDLARYAPNEFVSLIPPINVGECAYMPLVRESLHLSCELQILFLRQQDPGALISQGGDIDNRIKTLLDALRMPSKDEQDRSGQPEASKLFCLMESDTLVSRLDVDTDRLLFPKTDKPHEVHLVIEVSLNVLRVETHNMCLL